MVVALRLARFGCKNRAFWRLVCIDSKKARDAKPIEYLGTYNPIPYGLDATKEVRLRFDRIKYWLAVGAQPSDRVHYLLWRAGMLPPPPIPFTPTRWVPKKVLREQAKKFHTMTDAVAALLSAPAASGAAAPAAASAGVAPVRAIASPFVSAAGAARMASFSGVMSRPGLPFLR